MLHEPESSHRKSRREPRPRPLKVSESLEFNANLMHELEVSDENENLGQKRNEIHHIYPIPDDVKFLSSDEEEEIKTFRNEKISFLPRILNSSNSDSSSKTFLPRFFKSNDDPNPKNNMNSNVKVQAKTLKKEILTQYPNSFNEAPEDLNLIGQETEIEIDTDSLRNTRIRQLACRIKRLNIAYERERSKNTRLEIKIKEMTELVDSQNSNAADKEKEKQKEKEKYDSKDQKKNMKPKTTAFEKDTMLRKLQDQRRENLILKTKNWNLTKALSLELGPNFDIGKILRGEGTGKGRMQQITLLQSKVADLTVKLKAANTRPHSDFNPGLIPKKGSPKEKKEIVQDQKLIDELKEKQTELLKSQKKMEYLAARTRNLETGNRELRLKMQQMLKKSDNDDNLISALKSQHENSSISAEAVRGNENDRLITMLKEKSEMIEMLKCRIKGLEENGMIETAENSFPVANTNTNENSGTLTKDIESHETILEIKALRQEKLALETSLHQEKQTTAFLKLRMSRDDKPKHNTNTNSITNTSRAAIDSVSALNDKIDLLDDENQALKLNLKICNDSKKKDLEMYQMLLDATRK